MCPAQGTCASRPKSPHPRTANLPSPQALFACCSKTPKVQPRPKDTQQTQIAIAGDSEVRAAGACARLCTECCGFLCLGWCPTYKLTYHCRCNRGCSGWAGFRLPKDISSSSYCHNKVYNKGDFCWKWFSLGFNGKATYTVRNQYGVQYNSKAFDQDIGTIRLTC